MGAAVLFPNMNNIETWPNIYKIGSLTLVMTMICLIF